MRQTLNANHLVRTFVVSVALLATRPTLVWADAAPAPLSDANIHLRGTFENARIRFEQEKKGHVAFIGGSITEMNGYRPMVMDILVRRFPQTDFTFTDAGISSTCSTTGAFRLPEHVLKTGPVDLLFVEFAVNDDQDASHARRECMRGMEGIIRRTRLHNPNADIVITFFINPGMLKTWQAGQVPLTVAAHREVAQYYQIPTINLAKETADQISQGTLTWQEFGGTHPGPAGNRLCANMIDRLLTQAWSRPLPSNAKATPHPLPDQPLDEHSYFRGRLIGPQQAKVIRDAAVKVPDWSQLKGSCRSRFVNDELLCAEAPGAEVALDFQGTAVGAYILAGPDAGIVEARVDDKPPIKVNLFHRFSRGLHYPRTVMLGTELTPGKHTLHVRVSGERDKQSIGNAVRVLHFVAN